jgi:hypothetical protein
LLRHGSECNRLFSTVVFCDNRFSMAKWREIAKLLDSCHSLFLQEIGEPQENVLRLLLVEAKRSDEAESMQVGGAIIEDLHRVQATDESRVFELIWNQYI